MTGSSCGRHTVTQPKTIFVQSCGGSTKDIALVRSLINEGDVEIGGLRDYGARFEPWSASPDESLQRLSVEYVHRFDDRAGWPWTVWLCLTDMGKALGRTHQHAYVLWQQDVQARGVEDRALPLKFEPGCTQR